MYGTFNLNNTIRSIKSRLIIDDYTFKYTPKGIIHGYTLTHIVPFINRIKLINFQ